MKYKSSMEEIYLLKHLIVAWNFHSISGWKIHPVIHTFEAGNTIP
jgi:hypothetical protein